ncbi:MAG TPA: hypothetical protein VH596_06220 [Terriglobales bacterium]|jgi:hypothetical protein
MALIFKKSRMLLAVVVSFLAPWAALGQNQPPQDPPTDLVKSVIYNELHPATIANIYWKYRLHKDAGGRHETRVVVETKSGSLDRLVSVAGEPLTKAQQRDESRRILRFSTDPDEQRKAEQARRKDSDQCNAILKMIPEAFTFAYAGQNSNAIELTFRPNPKFQPPTRAGKVLQQMAGDMWVDRRQKRLISINGRLVNEVKFGGGLLGHLEKGGEFTVKRAELAPGDWEMTELTVNMRGRALLFKNISVQQKEIHSHFERVPDSLTLADAANMLLHQVLVASDVHETSGAKGAP